MICHDTQALLQEVPCLMGPKSVKKADLDDIEDRDVLRLVILFGASMC